MILRWLSSSAHPLFASGSPHSPPMFLQLYICRLPRNHCPVAACQAHATNPPGHAGHFGPYACLSASCIAIGSILSVSVPVQWLVTKPTGTPAGGPDENAPTPAAEEPEVRVIQSRGSVFAAVALAQHLHCAEGEFPRHCGGCMHVQAETVLHAWLIAAECPSVATAVHRYQTPPLADGCESRDIPMKPSFHCRST